MDIETLPEKKVDVNDVSKVSPRDIYMRLCACRDFEIKLQWERAVFLTAFLIACYAGYGSFLLSVHQHGCGAGNFSSLVTNGIFITLTFVGVVLSLFWILMAKGSKAWYEHYEQAISAFAKKYASSDVPEYMLAHQWYDMPGIERSSISNELFNFSGGAYSVSKIVIAIGFCSSVIWGLLFITHCGITIFGPISRWNMYEVALIIAFVALAIVTVVQLKRKLASGYLGKVEVLLHDEDSKWKKESWTHQMGSVKAWIQKQTKQTTRYILIEEKRISAYVCVKGKIKETIVFRRDQCMQFLKDKELGLYSLERSDVLED